MRNSAKLFTILTGLLSACSPTEPSPGSSSSPLTADQCNVFLRDGAVTICHRTASTKHPYTLVQVSENACVDAHADHAGDYVTSRDPSSPLYDPTCNGQGCLPSAAPCDGTVPCCEGLACDNGTCIPAFEGIDSCVHSVTQEESCRTLGGEPSDDASCPAYVAHRLFACEMGEGCGRLVLAPEPTCASGNGCFLDVTVGGSRCVSPVCGNGIREGSELCDDGIHNGDRTGCSQCTCVDSDGGIDAFVGGVTQAGSGIIATESDTCSGSGVLERYCAGGTLHTDPTPLACAHGCTADGFSPAHCVP